MDVLWLPFSGPNLRLNIQPLTDKVSKALSSSREISQRRMSHTYVLLFFQGFDSWNQSGDNCIQYFVFWFQFSLFIGKCYLLRNLQLLIDSLRKNAPKTWKQVSMIADRTHWVFMHSICYLVQTDRYIAEYSSKTSILSVKQQNFYFLSNNTGDSVLYLWYTMSRYFR